MTRHNTRRRRGDLAAIAVSLGAAAVLLPLQAQAADAQPIGAAAKPLTAPVYKVVQEGLTVEQGDALAERAGIKNALRADGSFAFRADGFATAPTRVVGEGRDEDGNPTLSEALDTAAIKAIKPISADRAKALAADLLPVDKGYAARQIVGNTSVEMVDARGKRTLKASLDTTVSYQLTLGGKSVIGPGAKTSVSFAGDGSVLQMTKAVRQVEQTDRVPIIAPAEAQRQCAQLYGGTEQGVPTLTYYAPPLAAQEGSGRGVAQLVVPHYACQPVDVVKDEVSALTGRLVPAAPSLQPAVKAHADFTGRRMTAQATVEGGTAPYSYRWSSSSVALGEATGPSVVYAPKPRERQVETLSLIVTDANGVSSTASLTPSATPGAPGSADATGTPGGTGGAFAESGIEQTVDEWACAQASADGFRSVMQSKGQSVNFDWRGLNAWERDFKEKSRGGSDDTYVDDVDIQWYTGHGSAGGFTFKNGSHDDGSIVPGDASWGDRDLEWLNLESCQVLRDTNGAADYFGRWGPTMNGLHLLNGFHTNATCVGGGTGRRFASYLFPENFLWWQLRPAMSVSQAWGSMANDLEPAGTRWRSMSLVGAGGVSNLGDHYWGQGSTGPDLTYANRQGMVAISGVA